MAAAVDVLDEHGLDGLTMRAVADRLGAGAMSLYRHVAGREELLDLVAARLAADIPATPVTGDWRTDLAALAQGMRAALLRRPNLTVLLTSRAGSGAGGLDVLDGALGILRAAGFSPRRPRLPTTPWATTSPAPPCGRPSDWAVRRASSAAGARTRRHAASHPSLLMAWPSVTWASGALFEGTADDRFEFGLASLLAGFGLHTERSRPR